MTRGISALAEHTRSDRGMSGIDNAGGTNKAASSGTSLIPQHRAPDSGEFITRRYRG
ncbi:unnamed protein product [Miscanthus lutarioriparius]|uniref:Uncharacterized protein n=1 Tax=Miscanthus lutarioriparius TaxID=422564 RepID=A0A811Q9D8_9POAL|nr:unnamed protein product [Miscanthus lutarioriparius]